MAKKKNKKKRKNTKIKGQALKSYIARKGLFIRLPIPSKLKGLEPEIALGRAILDNALLECLDKPEEEDWFDELNEDFHTICFIACLEPDKVLENFMTVIKKLKDE